MFSVDVIAESDRNWERTVTECSGKKFAPSLLYALFEKIFFTARPEIGLAIIHALELSVSHTILIQREWQCVMATRKDSTHTDNNEIMHFYLYCSTLLEAILH